MSDETEDDELVFLQSSDGVRIPLESAIAFRCANVKKRYV